MVFLGAVWTALGAEAPDDLKRSRGDAIIAAPQPERLSPSNPRTFYCGLLQHARMRGDVRDPVLAELYVKINLAPLAAGATAQGLAQTAPAAAQAIAPAQIEKTPDDPGALVLPQAQALFVGVLERAAAHGLNANWSASRVRVYAAGLARCDAAPEVREATRAAVLKAFGEAPGIREAVTPLESVPVAPAR